MTISRAIAITLVSLSIGFGTTAANAGPLRDAVSEASGTALFAGVKVLDKTKKVGERAAGTALFVGVKAVSKVDKILKAL